MRICVVTQDDAVSGLVREGVDGAILEILPTGAKLIETLTVPNTEAPRLVFIDLTSASDGQRALDFIKLSPAIARTPVVTIAHIGQAEQAGWHPDAVLFYPFTAAEVAALVTQTTLTGGW